MAGTPAEWGPRPRARPGRTFLSLEETARFRLTGCADDGEGSEGNVVCRGGALCPVDERVSSG